MRKSYLIINLLRPSNNINYNEISDTYFPKPLLDSNTQIIFIPETNKYENLIKENKFITLNKNKIIIQEINHLNKIKYSENLFDIFIFLLDKYEINLKHKKEYLSNLLNYYEKVKTKKKNYKWIDKENHEQLQWIIYYFQNTLKFEIPLNQLHYLNTIKRKCNHYEIIFLLIASIPLSNQE
ncbi:hypothetical protein [Acinetobacter lwoffii]|uniref:hypothetical protein n=1 Tax=Acinetobacter lwoffii TaxID=28090 RepID=UPI0035BC51CB|nr:hypothetical protein ABEDC_2501 [Acinetobacter lwoffii]